ncbi:MAG: DUF2058 domain-containing protein [Gammaproteobacteria bacterium]
MSNSLADQLAKAGLVDKKKAQKAENTKYKERMKKAKKKKRERVEEDSEITRQVKEAAARKQEKDRALNAARKAEEEQRALWAQVKQIVAAHRVESPRDDAADVLDYNFSDASRVARIVVSTRQHRQLGKGSLAIVRDGESYALVPGAIADRIASRLAEAVVVRHTADEDTDDDDPYADFKVPDDLMW